jgi:hypothetical protein
MLTVRVRTRRGLLFGVLTLATTLVLAGCSGGDDSTDTPSTPTPTVVDGLTVPGTDLAVDDAATVEFKDGPKRASKIKVVVSALQRGAIKDLREFDLNKTARQSGVYYVRATVRNVGHGDLGGAFVTLFGKVSDTFVVRPVHFGSTFGKCDYEPLPKPFGPGKHADVCMVMLAPKHGKVSAVEWRFDGQAPITWGPS